MLGACIRSLVAYDFGARGATQLWAQEIKPTTGSRKPIGHVRRVASPRRTTCSATPTPVHIGAGRWRRSTQVPGRLWCAGTDAFGHDLRRMADYSLGTRGEARTQFAELADYYSVLGVLEVQDAVDRRVFWARATTSGSAGGRNDGSAATIQSRTGHLSAADLACHTRTIFRASTTLEALAYRRR